ncbi:Panacea domain-containing protein [Nocardia sp. NPDC058379]|uniref:Panacea domain-containing protein n=1 Tax=unclassified Nocardia TaxID=2637762 RepID=UPI00365B2001
MLAANDVASVIIARRGTWMDAWSLQKLLYYVQAWHMAVTNTPLFEDRIEAWKDGPVVPPVWRSRRSQESRLAANQDAERVDLPPLASELIDLVLGTYGSMSGEELRALTHVEEPWMDARGDLGESASCDSEIPLDTMARFYRASRTLGGRTAADLSATGIYVRCADVREPVDVRGLLADMDDDYSDPGIDEWGGANLHDRATLKAEGVEEQRHRTFAGA